MSFVSHLQCGTCGASYSADRRMNLCDRDGRPVHVVYDLDRLRFARPGTRWWNPSRRNLWRFGGLLPLDWDDPVDRARIVSLGEGNTPEVDYPFPIANDVGFRLRVKDEGKHHTGFGANPTLSFKDRGMATTVSMARAVGIGHLAVPTQGNAGDSLARYAIAAGLRASIVMSPDTDRPVLGAVAALAALHPDRVSLTLVSGTIIDCGRHVRESLVPNGAFSVATFQEPGWRIEGKKTLGLEMAEPQEANGRWQLPDVIVYPTGGGTGILGMAKAFDELESLGLVGSDRPRFVVVQSSGTAPLVKAYEAGSPDVTQQKPGQTVATGLNVAFNVGHAQVLRVIRDTGGVAVCVQDDEILQTIQDEWSQRRFAWCPEGAAALAAIPMLVDLGTIRARDRVVVVNTASPEKYLPSIRAHLDGGL